MPRRARIVLFYVIAVPALAAQVQPAARVELKNLQATAGDTINASVTLDAPVPCSTRIFLQFQDSDSSFGISVQADEGATSMALQGQVPLDQPAGEYTSNGGYLNPCPGYSNIKRFAASPVTVTVSALPEKLHFPTSATVELSATQKQFLGTKIAELSDLYSRLNSRLDQGHADLPGLREFLIATVKSADDDLSTSEGQYRAIMKSQPGVPAFFPDFHAQYRALLINLRSPVPGLAMDEGERPALRDVQLKTRPDEQHLSNTIPAVASAVWQTIKDNIAAYKFVKDNGRATFTATIESFPAGARIQYKKLIDDVYEDYSSPTDVRSATFELATWIFRFHKDGCKDEPVLRINPYQDAQPDISVEFLHCQRR